MNSKRYIIIISSIALLVFGAIKLVKACAGGEPDPYDEYPSFFFNSLNQDAAMQPFYFTTLLAYYTDQESWYYQDNKNDLPFTDMPDQNINEWKSYTKNAVADSDIDSFIYTYPVAVPMMCQLSLSSGKPLKADDAYSNNTFLKWLMKNKDINVANYIVFAKKCEEQTKPLNDYYDNVDHQYKQPQRGADTSNQLIDEGLILYKKCDNDFLKWRYRYQVLRLAFYSNQYAKTIQLYNELVGDKTAANVMYARCLGMKAGALFHTGDKVHAAYLYSKVFDASDDMKIKSYCSFRWAVSGNIDSVLDLCNNAHEKAVLYIMKGLYAYNGSDLDDPEILNAAYENDPSVKGLDIVMTRAINKMEDYYLQQKLILSQIDLFRYSNYGGIDDNGKSAKDSLTNVYDAYLGKLNDFAQKVVKDGTTNDVAYWQLASSYIYYIMGDQKNCKKWMNATSNSRMTNVEHDVHDVINILYTMRNDNGIITAKTEAALLPSLKWVENRSKKEVRFKKVYGDVLVSVISSQYLRQGDTIKAIYAMSRAANKDTASDYNGDFTFDPAGMLLDRMSAKKLQEVQVFLKKTDKTPYEQWLLHNTEYSFSVLKELEGNKYIRELDFDKAVVALKAVSKEQQDKFALPDFLISHVTDYSDWNTNDSANIYNRLQFATIMADLQQKVKDPKDSRSAYQYANALYNMSYYGKAHNAYDYYHSSTDDNAYFASAGRAKLPEYEQEYYNVSLALKYYTQAFDNSTDKEFKARCLFLTAKCWQKSAPVPKGSPDSYEYYGTLDGQAYYKNALTNPYFKQFTTQYKTTKFYESAYGSCSYLRDYVKGK